LNLKECAKCYEGCEDAKTARMLA